MRAVRVFPSRSAAACSACLNEVEHLTLSVSVLSPVRVHFGMIHPPYRYCCTIEPKVNPTTQYVVLQGIINIQHVDQMICDNSRWHEKLGFLSEQKIEENQRIVVFLLRKKWESISLLLPDPLPQSAP